MNFNFFPFLIQIVGHNFYPHPSLLLYLTFFNSEMPQYKKKFKPRTQKLAFPGINVTRNPLPKRCAFGLPPAAAAESLRASDFIDETRWSEQLIIGIACFHDLNYKIGLHP